MKSWKFGVLIAVCSLVGIGVVSLLGFHVVKGIGEKYYEDHFLPGTVINGADCSGKTLEEAKAAMQDGAGIYALELAERGGKTETISGESLDITYQSTDGADQILRDQNNDYWYFYLGEPKSNHHTVSSALNYDEEKLEAAVDALDCMQKAYAKEPTDACITDTEDGFMITPESEGSTLDRAKLLAAVKEAVTSGSTTLDLEEEDLYVHPAVYGDDPALQTALEQLNTLVSANVIYDFTDRQWVVDSNVIKTFLDYNEDGTAVINQDRVYDWVYNMAYETDTFGGSRDFTTSYGVTVHLEAGGDYGWAMDKEATTEELMGYLNTGAQVVIQPQYIYTANDRRVNDVGGRYVEVCISTQTLWCYDNFELVVTTPVITGNVSTGHATPSGSVWAIDGKKADWKFTNYENAYSDFWMPFNMEVGLHDAQWQSDENYTIEGYYLENGSHGCVNIPYDAMELIFEHMEIGDPVVVYYSTEQVHGQDPTQELSA